MKYLNLFAASLVLLSLSGCGTFRASDFPLTIQLPASKDCVDLYVMSGREVRFPPEECQKKLERAVHLSSEAWKLLRGDIQTNCQFASCKQIQGAADGLFLSIDKAFQQMPIP